MNENEFPNCALAIPCVNCLIQLNYNLIEALPNLTNY